jgi:Na+/H+ antiporter NhaD/arsenite permease-like protein
VEVSNRLKHVEVPNRLKDVEVKIYFFSFGLNLIVWALEEGGRDIGTKSVLMR